MKEAYLLPSTCDMIRKSIKERQLSYTDVAKLVDTSVSTISRVCTGKTKHVSLDLVQKLETTLGILIYDALDDNVALIKRIEELEQENKLLKQLLIEKWQQ